MAREAKQEYRTHEDGAIALYRRPNSAMWYARCKLDDGVARNQRAAMIAALAATALSSMAFAGPWCPYTTCATVQDCESKADWVVEGIVSDIVSQGKVNSCWTRPGGGPPMCADIERPHRVLLERASLQKGAYDIDQAGHAELSPRSHCFSGPLGRPEPPMIRAQIEPTARGKRVRFYGFSKYTWEDLHPGYEIAVSVE